MSGTGFMTLTGLFVQFRLASFGIVGEKQIPDKIVNHCF